MKYAGALVGGERTFCVVPKSTSRAAASSDEDSKRGDDGAPPAKRRKSMAEAEAANLDAEMSDGKQVNDFAKDVCKDKGEWMRCVNSVVNDEVSAHTSMFAADANPGYHAMLPLARDWVVDCVRREWGGVEGNSDADGTDVPGEDHSDENREDVEVEER